MRKRRRIRPLFLILIMLLAVVFLTVLYAEKRLRPVLKTYAEAKGMSEATLTVNNAVCRLLEDEKILYSDLVVTEIGSDGNITNIRTDIVVLNQLKAKLSSSIVAEMETLSRSNIKVPLGTIFGGELFYGRGPGISVKLIPVGGVVTDISNQFSSAGINQTRHQIMLTVTAAVSIVLPSETVEKTVQSEFYLAETVIVGRIPDVYVNQSVGKGLS